MENSSTYHNMKRDKSVNKKKEQNEKKMELKCEL